MIKIISSSITRAELADLARGLFGDMIKAVVDVERDLLAVGGELHADEESLLLENGGRQKDLRGINLYPDTAGPEWIEFDSMVNIRPSQGNRSRGVDDPAICERIRAIVGKLIHD